MSKKLTNDLLTLIFNIGQALKEKARTNNKDYSFLHLHTLHYIKEREGILMREVANYLHITPPSATSLVNSLVKEGLVKRIVDVGDRRTVQLRVTAAGTELLKNSFKKTADMMKKSLNKLSDKEKSNFIIILKKIFQ
jgi:DNA-binding MarR family transcriptional regulator